MDASGSIRGTSARGIGPGIALIAWMVWPAVGLAQPDKRYELADLEALEAAFVKLAEDVRPVVVAIRTYFVRDPQDSEANRVAIPVSQGSGFVIDPDGYIATNRHVLEDANSFAVVFHSGQRYDATIQQVDPRSDLAVLKVDVQGLEPVRWGDLADVKVNQWTFACGNPFGLANSDGRLSLTYGVVSALGRRMTPRLATDPRIQYYGNLIETSSTINPGNSGGPLFNLGGQVIGVVTAIATSSGVSEGHGYAIPIDENTRRILDTLKAGDIVRYGYMGIQIMEVEPPRSRRVALSRKPLGARIRAVDPPDGPAAAAGLKADDIIIAVNGVPVEDSDHLIRLVSFSPVGEAIEVTYLRRSVRRTAKVMLADRHEMLGLVEVE